MPSSDHSVPGGVAAVVDPADVSPADTTAIFADSIELAHQAHAPRLLAILSEDKYRALTIFSVADLKLVESNVGQDKKGKATIQCLVTGKPRLAKPEEVVRQLWLARLLNHYHYPQLRLAIEFPATFGRDNTKRADIVIFDKDRPTVPYVIIKVKAVKLKDGKDQLKAYCNGTGAPLGVWFNGGETIVYNRRGPNFFVEIPDVPASNQTIEEIVNEPWTLEMLRQKYQTRERHRPIKQVIEEMEDEVLAGAGVDVFEEVFKLIFTKLYDELSHHQGASKARYLRFRNQNTESDLKNKIGDLFDEAKNRMACHVHHATPAAPSRFSADITPRTWQAMSLRLSVNPKISRVGADLTCRALFFIRRGADSTCRALFFIRRGADSTCRALFFIRRARLCIGRGADLIGRALLWVGSDLHRTGRGQQRIGHKVFPHCAAQ